MAELKPCPACGSKIATPVLEYDVKFPQLGYVRCREITCGLKTGLFADGGRHAVEIWNSLPRPDEVRGVGKWEDVSVHDNIQNIMIASMRCNVCKRYHNEVYHYGDPTEMARFCPVCGAKMEVTSDA